ncbi:glycyl-tRNA synthetase beta chain [Amphritea atlantica]|uniref:Glycine--tRNA ligase beta subunit n=1 Tax=Amphritea atlantica TaxID=355243 RepID=A0A1H9E962_9GAMM|nr:glycine--tRNA ligase subunit beta [Amphritea atlantica]SEQ22296.1 glycyl-tRNA synthetase beta chain [Amphritea atlantica]
MTDTVNRQDFLFELGTEELPPKALSTLSKALESEVMAGINELFGKQAATLLADTTVNAYAAPRRLALLINNLADEVPSSTFMMQGPPARIAFDEQGNPSKALEGFARKCGTTTDQLQEIDGKMSFSQSVPAKAITGELPAIIENALSKLPIPKRMRWGASRTEFVRPVKWVVMLMGDEVIECEILGLKAGRDTRGHRFHYNHAITLNQANEYLENLESVGYVIADFDERREKIRAQVEAEGAAINGIAQIDDDLLDEVTALNEWPVALTGRFDDRFLEVPSQALISSMKEHQKYFHVTDSNGQLVPFFITIANIESTDPAQVIAGNEKVIRPRLADAAFFFETDKKRTLESRIEDLKSIVFQQELGTLHDKAVRVAALAKHIAAQLGQDQDKAERAAMLAKTDLMTDMVYEFTDLQGLMGYHYAIHDGEDEGVAQAQNEQYMPRFAGDELPQSEPGIAVALADRLDTLTGLFGINQPPTGSKDPFALRRASLGVLRIIIERELDLDLISLIAFATEQHSNLRAEGFKVNHEVHEFIMSRLRALYQDQGIAIEAYLAVETKPGEMETKPLVFDRKVKAVSHFMTLNEAKSLAAANKRVLNILTKNNYDGLSKASEALLQEDAEKALATAVAEKENQLKPLIAQGDFKAVLEQLAELRPVVDKFFDEVMVMADDEAIRNNRLALLNQLRNLFLGVADISALS